MDKIILSKYQIQELVYKNSYRIDEKTKFISRCIDGRYFENKNLPALAIPGADVGEIALIIATGNSFGFEIDSEKMFKTFIGIVGGMKNFQLHTDHHGDIKKPASGCGHWKQINLDSTAYNLEKDQLKFIERKLAQVKKYGAKETILEGKHLEGAVLFVRGNYSIFPRYLLDLGSGRQTVEVFVYQATLVNERHKIIAEQLIRGNAVRLYKGCDGEYLYEVLSEMMENHLMETVRRLAKRLPIYNIVFKDDGSFTMEEMGKI